jgi:hypothetical protein
METQAVVTRDGAQRAQDPTEPTEPTSDRARGRRGVDLSGREAREMVGKFALPPFLTLDQAAAICQVKPRTLKNQVCQGRFDRSAIKGKPLRFVTHRFLQEFASRPERRN